MLIREFKMQESGFLNSSLISHPLYTDKGPWSDTFKGSTGLPYTFTGKTLSASGVLFCDEGVL